MANTVTSQTLVDNEKHCVIKFTNLSDGTAETAVKKVDVSALKAKGDDACTEVVVEKIVADVSGMQVRLLWDATADVACFTVSASGTYDFKDNSGARGLENDAGAGKSGDIMFTTIGASNNDHYSIVLYMRKKY